MWPLKGVKVGNSIIRIWDICISIPSKSTMLITNMKEFLWYPIKRKSYENFNFISYHNFLVFQLIHVYVSTVYMYQMMKMKFLISTTCSGLFLGPTKSSPATQLFIWTCFTRLSQKNWGRAGTLRNKVLPKNLRNFSKFP